MPTKQKQCIALDPESRRLLEALAKETEGNMSMAARFAIRDAARERGLTVDAQDTKERKTA